MSYDDEEESFEHTLLVVREVSVYKIPPRSSSGGYKCGEWLQSDKIWSGRLRVVSVKEVCEIRLEDANSGELFAACHVHPGKRDIAVEPATDSSRYFVLRIDDGRGKHAFIGLGFAERNEAFDFNVALSDHEKHLSHKDKDEAVEDPVHEPLPSLDLRLKEGETIKINVKTKNTASAGMMSHASGGNSISGTARMKTPLAPPPGGGRLRSPLPPPPNDNKHFRASRTVPSTEVSGASVLHSVKGQESGNGRAGSDPFADLSQLEASLPASYKSGTTSNKSGHAGWAAF
ncbi:hypothetical protein KP509_10G037100 [Ceratopteris richardii]|uniref:NECAP PHear domain-containing protein n=1 Tax=Ceratopteris richardii TaxID=49495 RepID=A0A8T2U0T9_CERRI|nr:hypothetical protein KP509_10G037100 [Ceratopteris richardii]KAH7427275.1 hypothetical protein KP509_10G037100 [Ceratopteris richardii]